MRDEPDTAHHMEAICTERMRRLEDQIRQSERVMDTRLSVLTEAVKTHDGKMDLLNGGGKLFTRGEHELYQKAVEADLRVLRESRAELAGAKAEMALKASSGDVKWALVIGAVGAVSGVASLVAELMRIVKS